MQRNSHILFCLCLLILVPMSVIGSTRQALVSDCSSDCNPTGEFPQKIRQIKNIFYNVPSPVEVTNLIRQMDLPYSPDLMNPVTNAENYLTQADIAINIGVYGADLSYIRIYEQFQDAAHYLSVVKRFTRELGIPEEQERETAKRLASNLQNQDSLVSIITQTFANSNSYLKENDRGGTAALIILGGWVETLYLATNIIESGKTHPELLDLVMQQKHSIKNLVGLLNQFPHEPRIVELLPLIKQLQQKFHKVESKKKKGRSTISQNGKNIIRTRVVHTGSWELFNEIRNINNNLRDKMVNL